MTKLIKFPIPNSVPNCLAISANENNNKNINEAASAFYDQPSAVDEEVGEVGDKRAGGRAFLPSTIIDGTENDKRGGGRAFSSAIDQQKRGAPFPHFSLC